MQFNPETDDPGPAIEWLRAKLEAKDPEIDRMWRTCVASRALAKEYLKVLEAVRFNKVLNERQLYVFDRFGVVWNMLYIEGYLYEGE